MLSNDILMGARIVSFCGFSISQIDLVTIIESSQFAQRLEFLNCKLEVDESFEISSRLDFRVYVLNFIKTANTSESDFLSERKMGYFLDGILKTTMYKSLKRILVSPDMFQPNILEGLLYDRGMISTIVNK